MKRALLFCSLVAATMAVTTGARAQNYPWCSIYSGSMGGSQNCGFSTYQQCMANVSGIGGFCMENNTYQPPAGPHGGRRKNS